MIPPVTRRPRIAVIGLASWDHLIAVGRYPAPGNFAYVREEMEAPGGTSANSAVAVARLGAEVAIASIVGNDDRGRRLCEGLGREGVDTRWIAVSPSVPTDRATVIVSDDPPDRTIYWHQGAHLVRGDRLDIPEIFAHDLVLIDADDIPLRRFLVDLPVHTLPATRLLGTLAYLAEYPSRETFEIALGHDLIVGNERELIALAEAAALPEAISAFRKAMFGANLRGAIISRGALGAIAFDRQSTWESPALAVDAFDTTGAGDAFAAAIAFGAALRWDWPELLRFANAVAGLSTTRLGAQTALPTFADVRARLADDPG